MHVVRVIEYHPKCKDCKQYIPIDSTVGLCESLNEVVNANDDICMYFEEKENNES